MAQEHLPAGLAAMPYHFRETPSNLLTNNAQDPYTKHAGTESLRSTRGKIAGRPTAAHRTATRAR
jgi:hypothetical protein